MKKKVKKSNEIILKVKNIGEAEIPEYGYESDAGFDLRANEDLELSPGDHKAVKTGLIFEIPKGYVGLIRDRAGIVAKMGIHTSAGTIDSGYRGELSIILINHSKEEQIIETGMRIAQMIIIPIVKPKIIKIVKIEETERGEKGFGSTGINNELDNLADEINNFVKKKKIKKRGKK
jgi:dUTP pyrophosphatase